MDGVQAKGYATCYSVSELFVSLVSFEFRFEFFHYGAKLLLGFADWRRLLRAIF